MNKILTAVLILSFAVVANIDLIANSNSHQFIHFTSDQGLSNSTINCIYQDTKGFIWVGTNDGLNRFDGYTFKVYRNNENNTGSIGHNTIKFIGEDSKGNLWVGTDASLDRYNAQTNSFIRHYVNKDINGEFLLSSENKDKFLFLSYYLDSRDYLWMCFGEGAFYYDLSNDSIVDLRATTRPQLNIKSNRINCFYEDLAGNIWLGTLKDGVYKLNNEISLCANYKDAKSGDKVYHITDIRAIEQINKDEVLIGTLGAGFYTCYVKKNTISHRSLGDTNVFTQEPDVFDIIRIGSYNAMLATNMGVGYLSLPQNQYRSVTEVIIKGAPLELKTIKTIFKDSHENIWLGTHKNSLFMVPAYPKPFKRFNTNSLNKDLADNFHVSALYTDETGNLLAGIDGGGLLEFDTGLYPVKHFTSQGSHGIKISSNKVLSICIDENSDIWAGTYYGGVNYLHTDRSQLIHFGSEDTGYGALPNPDIRDVIEDAEGHIWIATHGGGVVCYQKQLKRILSFEDMELRTVDSNYFSDSYVFSLCEDKNGDIWIGTLSGIIKYEKSSSSLITMKANLQNTTGLIDNVVLDILEDTKGNMWFGTSKGLHKLQAFDKENASYIFEQYGTNEGLNSLVVNSMVEDMNGTIWLGSNMGISSYDPKEQRFQNFTEQDGVFTKEFSVGAVAKRNDGRIFFGGPKGIVHFQPGEIHADTIKPIVIITDIKLFNKYIEPGEEVNNRVLLNSDLSELNEVTFQHRENVFTIEFVGIQFRNSPNNKYKYMLEGFNENWIETSANQRSATYTNLRPGSYTFHVIASNSAGFWNEEGDSIIIHVLPPIWMSKLAIVLYLIILIVLVYVGRRIIINRIKLRNELRIQKIETEKEHEITEMKMRFFTNISHEFKTPLTLIMGLVNKMLHNETIKSEDRDHLQVIDRNANRLQQLINQVLDMRRLQAGKLNFSPSFTDIIKFSKEITESFRAFADDLEIAISFKSSLEELQLYFDVEKLEMVLINLISNALKYTSRGGSVVLKITSDSESQVCIIISDSGIGIPQGDIPKIFDRFYQADNVPYAEVKSSGIGLSFVKDLVELHDGKISVESEPHKGTTFTILLPLDKKVDAVVDEEIINETELRIHEEEQSNYLHFDTKPKLLVVEDYLELRQYLIEELSDEYKVYDARNGKIGLEKALKVRPDIVISDIMMPEMDGFELCKAIKTHEDLSHTPVVILSSKTEEQAKFKGFEYGADAYIEKPFKTNILKLRIANIVSTRQSLISRLKSRNPDDGINLTTPTENNSLLKKAIEVVEENIGNTSFSTEILARELGMSRTKLYNKLGEASGHPVREFIQLIRLRKAAELITISDKSITEISYEVGFKDPAHFSKSFLKFYEKTPKDFRAKKD